MCLANGKNRYHPGVEEINSIRKIEWIKFIIV